MSLTSTKPQNNIFILHSSELHRLPANATASLAWNFAPPIPIFPQDRGIIMYAPPADAIFCAKSYRDILKALDAYRKEITSMKNDYAMCVWRYTIDESKNVDGSDVIFVSREVGQCRKEVSLRIQEVGRFEGQRSGEEGEGDGSGEEQQAETEDEKPEGDASERDKSDASKRDEGEESGEESLEKVAGSEASNQEQSEESKESETPATREEDDDETNEMDDEKESEEYRGRSYDTSPVDVWGIPILAAEYRRASFDEIC